MGMSNPTLSAENLINELSISNPYEIDVEAIAYDRGIEVIYEKLKGCEATLVGYGERAIATVNPSSSRGRQRFSVSHEIGHWLLHRGKSFRCRTDEVELNYTSDNRLEKEADEFASNLLMPRSIFLPAIRSTKQLGLSDLQIVANDFQVSLQAIALRLTAIDTLPIIVACYSSNKLLWCRKAPHVPNRWWLKSLLDEDSFAFDVLRSGKASTRPRRQSADAWFENDDSDEYEIFEQSLPSLSGQVLVLLYLDDPRMCSAGFDPNLRFKKK